MKCAAAAPLKPRWTNAAAKARSASKRNKVKWRYSNKSEETASETAETPASAPEA